MKNTRCVICGAAPTADPAALRQLLLPEDTFIAADGGWRLCEQLGRVPELVVADFDSLTDPLPPSVERLSLPVRKDDTDLAVAADRAVCAGFRELLLLGCTGGRLDHQMANQQLLCRLAKRGCHAVMADENNRIEAVTVSPVTVPAMPGWSLSLFAAEPVGGLTLTGTAYPLDGYDLMPGDSLCVSNRVTAPAATVTFRSGTLLLFRSKD